MDIPSFISHFLTLLWKSFHNYICIGKSSCVYFNTVCYVNYTSIELGKRWVRILWQQQTVFRQRPSIFFQPSQPQCSLPNRTRLKTSPSTFLLFLGLTLIHVYAFSRLFCRLIFLRHHCWSFYCLTLSSLLFYVYIFSL